MSKLMAIATLGAGLLLITACGGSPNDPSEIPAIAQASAPTSPSAASTGHTSGKRPGQILPPSSCAMGQELSLQIAARGKGYVEVSSNYLPSDRACEALAWQLDADVTKEVASESFPAQGGEGLRLFPGDSTLRGAWVTASAPDGQVAKLYVDFHVGLSSDETLASGAASVAHTSRKRPGQILPPSSCAMGQELSLQIVARGKGYVEVASNYQQAERGCAALAWQLEPSAATRELPSESFAAASGEGLRVFHGGSALRGAWVAAYAPDGQVARLHVEFNASVSSDETN